MFAVADNITGHDVVHDEVERRDLKFISVLKSTALYEPFVEKKKRKKEDGLEL